jgi:hypothetical protein
LDRAKERNPQTDKDTSSRKRELRAISIGQSADDKTGYGEKHPVKRVDRRSKSPAPPEFQLQMSEKNTKSIKHPITETTHKTGNKDDPSIMNLEP